MIASGERQGRSVRGTRRSSRPLGLVGLMLGMLLIVALIPVSAVLVPWHEHRIRRSYRRAGRYLQWDDARERLLSGRGTLLIEQTYTGLGHVWWIEPELRVKYPDCPLAPARVLTPPHIRERLRLTCSDEARRWSAAHIPGFAESVHLVRVPSMAWRRWDEVLFGDRAMAVFF